MMSCASKVHLRTHERRLLWKLLLKAISIHPPKSPLLRSRVLATVVGVRLFVVILAAALGGRDIGWQRRDLCCAFLLQFLMQKLILPLGSTFVSDP